MTDSAQKDTADSALAGIIETPSAAKVTLVKPLPGENAGGSKSNARPKVGRAHLGPVVTADKEIEAEQPPEDSEPGQEELKLGDKPPHEAPRSELKFTLFLITLFIAVNAGLIALLHNTHQNKAVADNAAAPAAIQNAAPQTEAAALVPAPVVKANTAASAVTPTQAVHAATTPKLDLPVATAPKLDLPVAPSAPATSPTAQAKPSEAETLAALQPSAGAAVPKAAVAAKPVSSAGTQDLLSIISKE